MRGKHWTQRVSQKQLARAVSGCQEGFEVSERCQKGENTGKKGVTGCWYSRRCQKGVKRVSGYLKGVRTSARSAQLGMPCGCLSKTNHILIHVLMFDTKYVQKMLRCL